MDDFLQKLKKMVRIVLYGTAISQSDCRKAGPYQLPLIIPSTDQVTRLVNSSLYSIIIFQRLFKMKIKFRLMFKYLTFSSVSMFTCLLSSLNVSEIKPNNNFYPIIYLSLTQEQSHLR